MLYEIVANILSLGMAVNKPLGTATALYVGTAGASEVATISNVGSSERRRSSGSIPMMFLLIAGGERLLQLIVRTSSFVRYTGTTLLLGSLSLIALF